MTLTAEATGWSLNSKDTISPGMGAVLFRRGDGTGQLIRSDVAVQMLTITARLTRP